MGVADPVAYLTGRWTLDRRITDLASGRSGTFVGTAEFLPSADGLAYAERGELRFGPHAGPAWRAYTYRRVGDGLRVEFDDGRFFHDLDLRTGVWTVTHPCRADAYVGEFRVVSGDRWTQDWRVTGPAKELRLVTTFTRA
ncbi:MAG TPA: DUF6314 family protein [Actinocatenispora sp.]